jgi:hypothetical protein
MNRELRDAVLLRDGCCILLRLDPDHRCRDRWGKKAPTDMAHLVALCGYANVAVPSKATRDRIREYLRRGTVDGYRVPGTAVEVE